MSDDGDGPRDLLVASAGGHLTQLHMMAQRLEPRRPRTWVTYDHPQSLSMLAGEDVVLGHGPSSRSVRAAVANWALSGELVDPTRFARVVSTGSAISVPFLVRAERRGIEAHYIESATRSHGPSLSGRILEHVTRDVGLHTQHPGWAGGRWRVTASVFDGFDLGPSRPRADGGLRVVVSLGTHRFAFGRLLDELSHVLRSDDEVFLQHGATEPVPLPGSVRSRASVATSELEHELSSAHVLVAHAGTGIALTALRAGLVPVLVPRQAARGEHVDDHQALTAGLLSTRGLAVVPSAGGLRRADLESAARGSIRASDAARAGIQLA